MELLVTVAVLSILGGVNAAVLSASFEAWRHVQLRLDLQEVAHEMMDLVLEGGFDEEGLKAAVELTEAKPTSIEVLPLWTDHSHRPDKFLNKEQKFTLEKQFKLTAATPVAQVLFPETVDWETVPILFEKGSGSDPKHPDDVVTFPERIPAGSKIRIVYTPDSAVHPKSRLRFWYEPKEKQVYRAYNGESKPILKRTRGVKVQRLAFLYYNNLNQLLPIGKLYSEAQRRRITGVKIYILFTRGLEWKEMTTFTNIRNVTTIGVTISQGSILPLPSPQAIRALSVGDFTGLAGGGIVEMEIHSAGRARWKITLEFKPAADPALIILHRFKIEAPPGRLRTSGILDQTIATNEFINLLAIDRTGRFDYDDDRDIQDAVIIQGESNVLVVTRCDFDAASMFVRP